MKHILVTGGLGYIGSHTVVELINEGYNVIIIDDLSNSHLFVLDRIEEITGVRPTFYKIDLKIKSDVQSIFKWETIDAVIHFAAHKAVGESVQNPLKYYKNNLLSLIHLLEVMEENSVNQFIFSSSATVYGVPSKLPVTETTPLQQATNPYGYTKRIAEDILKDVCNILKSFKCIALRYFNPVGAHESAKIGELPDGVPNNLMPYITQTAAGKREKLTIFGDDYNTRDGSAIRDYIHVVDLAKAHVASIQYFASMLNDNFDVFNIGTGRGYSVKEILKCFEAENNLVVKYQIGGRRNGDVPEIYADTTKANKALNWKAEKSLADMVRSSWAFQKKLDKE